MKTFYHGTTVENAEKIIKEGFDEPDDMIWDVSVPGYIYLTDESFDDEETEDWAKTRAIEAAQIAAAHYDSMKTSVILFKFTVPDELAAEFEPDDSCENADGCVQGTTEFCNKLVDEGYVSTIEVEDAYHPMFRLMFLPSGNRYYTFRENRIASLKKIMDQAEIYFAPSDYLDCIIHEPVPVSRAIKHVA